MNRPEQQNKQPVSSQHDAEGRVHLANARGFDQVVGQNTCVERLETFGRLAPDNLDDALARLEQFNAKCKGGEKAPEEEPLAARPAAN